jgi:O-antigen ligase
VFGFPRVQATFLEPLLFANFLFLPIFFNIEKILKEKKIAALTIVAQILFSMIFLLTLSRGAYFGLAGSILVSLGIVFFKYRSLLKKFILAVSLTLIGIIFGIALIFFTAPSQSFNLFIAHSTVADTKTGESTISRLETAHVAMNYFKVKPWGVGAGAFGALSEYKEQIPVSGFQTVSNFYLEILVEEGIVGFFLFVFFLLLILNHLGQGVIKSDQQSLIFVAIFVAIFIQAITFSALYTLPIWAFFALAWPKPAKG